MSQNTPEQEGGEDEMSAVVQKLIQRMALMCPPGSFRKAASLELKDPLLCCGVKSGTTWLQHIVHGLRSGGSMDFDEISSVFPFIEFLDVEAFPKTEPPQAYQRICKTHLCSDLAPKTSGKRIIITRNPMDAAVSSYYFYGNWFFELDELSLDDFIYWTVIKEIPQDIVFANAFQMQHLASWYPHRKDEKTLWLHYEDMIADLPKCIKMISDFLEIGVGNEELLKLVEKQASIEFMKKHKSHFDLHQLKLTRNAVLGLSPRHGIDNNPGKVRKGKAREGEKLLSEEMKKKMAEKWKTLIEPVTGHSTYEEMRTAINEELGRTFP